MRDFAVPGAIVLSMIENNILTQGIVGLLALSFWSSGVFLIRILNAYQVWNGGILLACLFVLSIPLIYLSIKSVQKMFRAIGKEAETSVYYIIALVLILHAVVLSLHPELYSLVWSPALAAAAWLLWFGGSALIMARVVSKG